MSISRRQFLTRSAGALALSTVFSRAAFAQAPVQPGIQIGACDWSLGAGGADGLDAGKKIGLNGIEIAAGGADDTMWISLPDTRKQIKDAMARSGLSVCSVALSVFNGNPMATESRAEAWVEQCIEASADLGAKVILLAFFGKGDLRKDDGLKQDDVASVTKKLKALAPKAEKAGVILGIEDTLTAADNLKIVSDVGSPFVKVYYDVGNSHYNGYDVPKEICELGANLCQIHFKDGGHYLGKGKVPMDKVAESLKKINYKGWVVLETSMPDKDRDADFKRNADYSRKLLGLA